MVENPGFWNWTFTLKDIHGEVLAEIDRDWRGFGFEVGFQRSLFLFHSSETESSRFLTFVN